VAAATVYNTPDDGRKTASETCRVITPNKEKKVAYRWYLYV